MSTGKEVAATGGLSVRALWTLWAIDDGLEFVAEPDGTMVVVLPRQVAWEVGDEVDELLARGWVEHADVIGLTDAGRYWSGRLKKKHGGTGRINWATTARRMLREVGG